MTQAPADERLQPRSVSPAWSDKADWRLLATRFESGMHFLQTWHDWQTGLQCPKRLHYVGLSEKPLAQNELLAGARARPHLLSLALELADQWPELRPGFYRFTLARGDVLLTLCVGELIPLLKKQHFLADEVFLDASPLESAAAAWSRWHPKALARCCRRGTLLTASGANELVRGDLTQCGFDFATHPESAPDGAGGGWLHGQFNPRWTLRALERAWSARVSQPGTCAVVGAGLAGASVAAALARRGWQIQVLDGADAPAEGASGLPVGLVVPHVSVDDCALSRLSRAGVRLMLWEARTLLKEGEDWAPSGVLESYAHDDSAPPLNPSGVWHGHAAWLKPARLVRAWLAQPGITFLGGRTVDALRYQNGQWELLNNEGRVLACADRVVLANACGVQSLLDTLQATPADRALQRHSLPPLHRVRGQVSWAMHASVPNSIFPLHPVNGGGSVIPGVPWQDGLHSGQAWFAGATYQRDDQPETPDDHNHASNLARVQRLLPKLGPGLAAAFANGLVRAWKNTRCVTADRLPLVGPVNETGFPGLWVSTGMGSRGLSFSVLCAELLAAQWHGEPWVIEARLARMLTAHRGAPAPMSRRL